MFICFCDLNKVTCSFTNEIRHDFLKCNNTIQVGETGMGDINNNRKSGFQVRNGKTNIGIGTVNVFFMIAPV